MNNDEKMENEKEYLNHFIIKWDFKSDTVSEDSIYDEGCSSHIEFYIVLGYTPHTLTTILKQTLT